MAVREQGEQQTFNGKVTAVKDGFCFMESRPGERCVLFPATIDTLLARAAAASLKCDAFFFVNTPSVGLWMATNGSHTPLRGVATWSNGAVPVE